MVAGQVKVMAGRLGLATAMLAALGACGGGETSEKPPSAATQTEIVSATSSPITGRPGVATTLLDGTRVYALGPPESAVSGIRINVVSERSGTDMSRLAGKAVFEFSGVVSRKTLAAVWAPAGATRVYECEAERRTCTRLPASPRLATGEVVFPVTEGRFYAVERLQ